MSQGPSFSLSLLCLPQDVGHGPRLAPLRAARWLRWLQASNPENNIQRKKRSTNVFPRSSSADFLSALIGQNGVTWSFLSQSLATKRFIPWIKLTPGCQSVDPRPAESVSPENLSDMEILGPHPRTTESETLGVGLSKLHFNSI